MDPSANTLFMMLEQAGWTMYPLYVCSFLALAVLLKKVFEFWTHRVLNMEAMRPLERMTSHEDLGELAAYWETEGSPLGRVLGRAARMVPQGREVAEREASRAAIAELDRWERWLALLAFIAQVAPLFGLLGTVLGMVDLFGSMEAAGAEVNTSTLSGGIWKALLTTAAGLIVAIPTMGGHLWFTRRLDLLRHRLEEGVGGFLDRVFHPAMLEKGEGS